MPVRLEIRDGQPWYASTSLALVDADDYVTEVLPTAGVPCHLRARVLNGGDRAVTNAIVRFYWANPSVGIDRATAYSVGTAFVSLDPGQEEEVLCLTPWVPTPINGGHSCILAEAFHPSADPLPVSNTFQVPTDRHVAQRTLSVIYAQQLTFTFPFEIYNMSQREQPFRIEAQLGDADLARALLKPIGIQLPSQSAELEHFGFTEQQCPTPDDLTHLETKAEIDLGIRGMTVRTLAGQVKTSGSIFLTVNQLDQDGRTVGGLGVIVVA